MKIIGPDLIQIVFGSPEFLQSAGQRVFGASRAHMPIRLFQPAWCPNLLPAAQNSPAGYPLKLSAASAKCASIFADHLDHYSFDFNDVLLADREVRIFDCGQIGS
jgi:hypothetical protein